MNPSSFNQNFRRYSQDTCDLMIEDKKSPFPTWMNFNKPNPLKFSLGLTDPDRPEQPPIRITGDRTKLESLHQAVEGYVSKLLSKTPLPELNEQSIEQPRTPAPPASTENRNFNLKVGDGSIKIKMGDTPASGERPIDALNTTGDQPYLEADGLSRHLLYLGNIATDNQAMVSLNTLQLFDLASTLAEGVLPVGSAVTGEMTDFGAAVANPPVAEPPTVEVIQPDVTPAVTNRFANNVTEPRVVKPLENNGKNKNSEEFSSTGAASSLQHVRKSPDRFKVPNISFNKSRLTDSFDSASPLSTIWPWLGVGAVAAGIIGTSLLGGNKEGSLSSKPTVSPTNIAKATTGVSELPSPVPMPSGLDASATATPTITGSPGPSSVPGATVIAGGPSPGVPGTNPGFQIPSGGTPGLLPSTGGFVNGSPGSAKAGLASAGSKYNRSSKASAPPTFNAPLTSNPPTAKRLPTAPVPQGVPVDSAGSSGFNFGSSGANADFPINTNQAAPRPVRGKGVKPSKAAKRPVAPPSIDDGLPGSVAAGDDLFAPADSKNNDIPVKQLPADSNINALDAPDAAGNASGSLQATETQTYFKKRWKAYPDFSDTLQYVIRFDKNGKAVRVTPQGDISKSYLDKNKASFLRSGEKIVSPSRNGKDQDVRVLLKPNGEVETIIEP
jgi:Domain of unknown function (DUF4335)